MSSATFDTLTAARKLEAAGVPAAQAEAMVETVRAAVSEGVATKADLKALELRLVLWGIGLASVAVGVLRWMLGGEP